MSPLALTGSQLRYVNKAFWRNPTAAIFTFAFPLMFLVIFTSLLGNGTVHVGGREVRQSTYYVAAMAAFAVITACYNNLATGLAVQRDSGVLRRISGTPLPVATYFVARVAHAVFISALLVAITVGFGAVAYDAHLPDSGALVRFVLAVLVGAAAFAALGFAVTAVIPTAEAAPAVVNATILPLLFLSGIFIPLGDDTPAWVSWVARIFPVRHLAVALRSGFLGTGFRWSDLLVLGLWGLGGLALAVRFFRWEPRV